MVRDNRGGVYVIRDKMRRGEIQIIGISEEIEKGLIP